jgi:hypothetical protein
MSREGCPEEDTQQNNESPDIVRNDEPIVYALVYPTSASEQSIAYFHGSRLKDRELSICRARYSSYGEMREKVVQPQLDNDATREFKGYLWAPCYEIRSILATPRIDIKEKPKEQQDPVGAFCVIDDGDTNFRAHARLGYSAPNRRDFWSKNDREAARGNLSLTLQVRGIHRASKTPPFPKARLSARRAVKKQLARHQILRMQRALRKAFRRAARRGRRQDAEIKPTSARPR